MSQLLEQGSASIEEPTLLASSLAELIELPDTPLEVAVESSDQHLSGVPQVLAADEDLFVDPKPSRGALVEGNLPPMLAASFAADPVLALQQEFPVPMSIELVEDQPFTVLLDGLNSGSESLSALSLLGADWLTAGLVEADATIGERLVIETQLRNGDGERLVDADLPSLVAGSNITVVINVSDTRLDGLGLIGLQGDLQWNPDAAEVLSLDLADTLPLFRRSGDAADWADGHTTLIAAALPKAGAGEALGDSVQERFAEIALRINDPRLPLNLEFIPELYPAVGRRPIPADQLLNLGLNPQKLPLLQGQPLADFHGSVELQLQVSLENGEGWIQPLQIIVAPRNDAPQAIETQVELEPIGEDMSDPPGASVEALFAEVFSDVDGDQLAGVAITQIPASTSAGVWQFSVADQPWQTLNSSLSITEASALVLLTTDRLRFLPEPDWSSDQPVPALSLRLIDSSRTITSAGRVDVRNPAADSAFSAELLQLSTGVTPVNDAPQAGPAETPLFRGREGKAFSVALPDGFFVDPDPTEVLSYSLSAVDAGQPVPAWLVIDPATGRLSGVPTEVAPDPFTLLVVAADSSGAEVSREIRFQIRPVDPNNNPPQAEPSQRLELLDTEQRLLNLAEIFQDPDPGDTLNYTVAIPASQAHWIAFDPETAELLLQPGLADVTAPDSDVQLTLTAEDRDGATAVQVLSIAVLNTNQAPVAREVGQPRLLRLNQDDLFELDLSSWFSDPDLPFGDNLTFSLETTSGDTVSEAALDWLSWLPDGSSVVGRPGNSDVGILDVVATATDRDGLSAQQTLRLLIDNVNDAPQLTELAPTLVSVDENTPLSLDLSGWFEDPDAIHGESFSLELSARGGLPAWLSWDPETAALTGTPTSADLGVLQLRLRATDGLAITSHTFEIEVNNVNEAPVVRRSLEPLSLLQDANRSLDLSGAIVDVDPGDLLRYSLRITDSEGQELPLDQQSWLQLKTSAENAISREDRLLIQPVLRAVSDGRILSAEEVSGLPAGSQIDVEIQIEDNREGVALTGLLGADLTLNWNPAVLSPLSSDAAILRQGISSSLPLFASVDTVALAEGRLGLSAAAAPAFGVGEAVGDQPAERFATVRMQLLDPSLPVVLNLSVNSEEQGGLGLGWQDESDADARLTLGSFSSSNRLDLELSPGNAQVGRYSVELSGTDLLGLVASTAFELDVINVNDAPLVALQLPAELMERQVYRFPLEDYFSDPDLIHGDQLSFQLTGNNLPGWVSLSEDRQYLEFDVPALDANQSLDLAIAAVDRAGEDALQAFALSLRRKLLLSLDTQQRQWILDLDSATPEQRVEAFEALRASLQSVDAQERGFQPLQKTLHAWLDRPDQPDSPLALQEVLLSANWLESPDEYVTQIKQEGGAYVFSDGRSVLDSVRALAQPQVLLQSSSNALSYQALLEPIEFSAEAEQGFSVVTIALPPDQPLNSLVKTVWMDDALVVAPFAVRTLDLASLRAEALEAGLLPSAYQNLLDEQLNLFQLHRYPTGEALSELRITPETDLLELAESLPRDQLDGSAILIDFDGDGAHDVARLLLLDDGFFDNDKVTPGRIDDPLVLARATPLLAAGGVVGGGRAASSSGDPADEVPVVPAPREPSLPDSEPEPEPELPQPEQPDFTPVEPSAPVVDVDPSPLVQPLRESGPAFARRGAFAGARRPSLVHGGSAASGPYRSSPFRPGLLGAGRGGQAQMSDESPSSPSSASGELSLSSAVSASNHLSPPSRRGVLEPLVQTLQRGFDALAEIDLVDLVALAAMVLPITAQAGLQGGKQLKPFSLRLKNGDSSGSTMPSLAHLVFGETLLDPLLETWIEHNQGRVRIHSSFHAPEQADCSPQLYRTSQLWLWQRVRHTSQPGALVESCLQALQTLEREGLRGSGLDCDAWLSCTLTQHQKHQSPSPASVSSLDFIAQLLGCLANLGYPYQSVAQ